MLDPGEWEQRDEKEGGVEGGALTREEREERDVRRAVEEERYSGTKGRDLMGYGGSGGITEAGGGEKTKGLRLKMDDSAKKALAEMGQQGEGNEGDGKVVQLVRLSTVLVSLSETDSALHSPSTWLPRHSSSPLLRPTSRPWTSHQRSPPTHHPTPSITTRPPPR